MGERVKENKPSMPRKKRSRRESLDAISTFEGELNIPKKKKAFLENLDIKAFFKILKEFTEEENPIYEDVVSRILEVLPSTDASIPLSSITNEDEGNIDVLPIALIKVDETKFEEKLSEPFAYFSQRIGQRWNLKAEIGRRTIIDLYLLEACGKLEEKDNLAVFPEHSVKEAKLTDKLTVHGNIDYVIATAQHPPGVREERLFRGEEMPKTPYFCVVEAKKDESFGAGATQTLAEMKAIWALSPEKHPVNGALTDGNRWIFYRLDKNGISCYETKIITHSEKSHIIAGILKSFIRGELPVGCEIPT